MTVSERALRYAQAMPPAIAGQGGHAACFSVACALVHGFALAEEEALGMLRVWNTTHARPPWNERELRHKVSEAAKVGSREPRGYLLRRVAKDGPAGGSGARSLVGEGVAPKPIPPPGPRLPAYEPGKLRSFAAGCGREITPAWLRDRSPVPLPQENDAPATSRLFIDSVFAPGEKVLIFNNYYSQGDFLAEAGGASWRLADRDGIAPVASELPLGGRQGVWFLSNPMDGAWHIAGERWSRRSEASITSWQHLVLESDEAPVDLWLKALVLMPLPLVAIFTSGGRSVHALARIEASSKPEFDAMRDVLRAVTCPLGADGRAMSGVRLSRLPGCLRHGAKDAAGAYQPYPEPRRQRLLWLNPQARAGEAIFDTFK